MQEYLMEYGVLDGVYNANCGRSNWIIQILSRSTGGTWGRGVELGHVVQHDAVYGETGVLLVQVQHLPHILQAPCLHLHWQLHPLPPEMFLQMLSDQFSLQMIDRKSQN